MESCFFPDSYFGKPSGVSQIFRSKICFVDVKVKWLQAERLYNWSIEIGQVK